MKSSRRALDFLVVMAVIAAAAWFFRPHPVDPMVGVWEARDGEERIVMELGPVPPGKSEGEFRLSSEHERHSGTYRTDRSRQPALLDVTAEGKHVTTIFALKDDELRIADTNPDEPRPRDFSGHTVVFHRVEHLER